MSFSVNIFVTPVLYLFGVTKLLELAAKFSSKAEELYSLSEQKGHSNPEIACQEKLFNSEEAKNVYKIIIFSKLTWFFCGICLGIIFYIFFTL